MALSPIDVELLRNAMGSIADEMYYALMKSAYSTNIKERHDHSATIFDGQGRVLVQGDSLPLHLASILGLVGIILDRFGPDDIHPGDMFISNDPFVGRGSHLPDVALVAPVFHQGELAMFVGNIAHHADIGGMAPGSMAGGMTEIYQEGLRIPPIKLMRGDEIIKDVFDLILLNVRVPHERRGDYAAQIAANRLGVRRCGELLERWSLATVREGADAIIAAVTRRLRAAIADLPDGEYRGADVMDDDGMGQTQIEIAVKIVVTGDDILFDFSGSAPQVKGNINVSSAGLQACVFFALKVLLDPGAPMNHGMLEPIRIEGPEGTIVNASFPAATAARAQTCQRIVDVIFAALAEAIPERVMAAGNGANTTAVFSGNGPGRGSTDEFYVYLETIGGGIGGRSYKDGAEATQAHLTNTSNLPIEALEKEYPLMIERYELVDESGGAGTWRGGLGLRRVYRPIGHVMTFSGQGERCINQPPGLFGGGAGATGSFSLQHDDGTAERLPGKPPPLEVPPASAVSVITPGAGGYGPPEQRDRTKLAEDLASGKFSAEFLDRHYGYRAPSNDAEGD
jgi:N-methylhydantoinase B